MRTETTVKKRRKTASGTTCRIPTAARNAYLEYLSTVNYLDSMGVTRTHEGCTLTMPERINAALVAARGHGD